MFLNRCWAIGLFLVAAAIPLAAEDLTIVAKHSRGEDPPSITTSYITDSKIRMASGEGNESIVDLATGTITILDNKKKEYSILTKQDLEAAAQSMKDMESRMQNLPPEIREKMAGAMGSVAQGITVEKGQGSRTIAGFNCDNWVVTLGPNSRQEHCITTQLQFPPAAFDGMKAFADSMRVGPMRNMSAVWDKFKDMRGYPLATKFTMTMMGRTIVTNTEVTEVKRGPVAPSAFEVPADYKKVDSVIPKMGQRPPR